MMYQIYLIASLVFPDREVSVGAAGTLVEVEKVLHREITCGITLTIWVNYFE
jgi:hypothetical protein